MNNTLITNFGEAFTTQLTNPNCSYLTGMLFGSLFTLRYISVLVILYFGFRFLDTILFTPLLEYLKSKIYKVKP